MAKAKTKKLTKKDELPAGVLSPQKAHELFGQMRVQPAPRPRPATGGHCSFTSPPNPPEPGPHASPPPTK